MAKLSELVRGRLAARQRQVSGHPAADVLLALSERSLRGRERDGVLEHLAHCPECREILALSSAVDSESSTESDFVKPRVKWWYWRWAAGAAVACLVAAMVWHPAFEEHPVPPAANVPSQTPELKTQPPTQVVEAPQIHHAKTVAPAKPEVKRTVKTFTLPQEAQVTKKNEPVPALPDEQLNQPAPRGDTVAVDAIAASVPPPAQTLPAAPQLEAKPAARSLAKAGAFGMLRARSVWNLSANDKLQKSDDGGRTWHTMEVAADSRLYAISATGSDIWTGGAGGRLFHSADAGSNWTELPIADGDLRFTDPIVRIEVSTGLVKVKSKSGAVWISNDSGLHWHRE